MQRALDIAALATVALLLVHWRMEYTVVRRFIKRMGVPPADPRARALHVIGWVYAFVRAHKDDPPYLHKVLSPIGATPGAVLVRGGCCSGLSRLCIISLSAIGRTAHQVTLYHRAGHAQHCLIEVQLPDGRLVADPLYGFYYTDGAGRSMGMAELQQGAQPHFVPLPFSTNADYPAGPYYDFDYTITKTANWTKSWPRRRAYAALRAVTGGTADRLRVPVLLEWPQVLLGAALIATAAAGHAVRAIVAR